MSEANITHFRESAIKQLNTELDSKIDELCKELVLNLLDGK